MFRRHTKAAFIVSAVVFFITGFLVHAYFFPSFFIDSVVRQRTPLSMPEPTPEESTHKALTIVEYRDGIFIPPVVKIKKSYYLGIVNRSEHELMWLTSDTAYFNTKRGYGTSEELRNILYDPATHIVSSKLHPENTLRVIVE